MPVEFPKEEAKDLLKDFGILFVKNYGATVFAKIKEEVIPTKEAEDLKLKYRPAAEEKRPDLFAGECYMKKGEGAGSFGGWKNVFVAEGEDNSIEIFSDEKAYKGKKKPTIIIKVAGYKVVTEVSSYYANCLRSISNGLGLTDDEVTAMTTFSRYSWALAHPQRMNYVFQIHKGKNPACPCFGAGAAVDPDDAGADRRDDIIKYVDVLKRCVNRSNEVCNKATGTSQIAFRKSCEQIPDKSSLLANWTDNGTEPEMLLDMLIEALLPTVREHMFTEMKGPASTKLKMWYKSVGAMQKVALRLISPVWDALRKKSSQLDGKVEDAVRPAVAKILAVKDGVEKKISASVGDTVGPALGKYVTPFIKPIIDIFEHPMKRGFDSGREIVATKFDMQTLSQDKKTRDDYLECLARSSECVSFMHTAALDLVEPLRKLKELSNEVFGDLDPEALSGQAEDTMIKTVDAAAYTIAVMLDGGEANNEELLQQLLKDYDHDSVFKRCEFVKDVARQLLIGSFKKLTSPTIKPLIEAANDQIPEEMQDFLNLENILDNFIDTFVGTPIDKVVEAAYPLK